MVNISPGLMFLPVFHKDPFLAPFCLLFISMIYLMILSVTQNCLKMIPHYLQQCIILAKQQMIWVMTWPKSQNGLSKRKWALIQIFLSSLMKIFSSKGSIASYPPLTCNNIPVAQTNSQKHLGMHLDKKLNFDEHLSKVEWKVNKISVLFANTKMFFHDQHFLQLISHSLGLT